MTREHKASSYLQFLLLHADFRVLLSSGQGSSKSLLPLAFGPLGNRSGDGDGCLHNVDGGVFRQIIQLPWMQTHTLVRVFGDLAAQTHNQRKNNNKISSCQRAIFPPCVCVGASHLLLFESHVQLQLSGKFTHLKTWWCHSVLSDGELKKVACALTLSDTFNY